MREKGAPSATLSLFFFAAVLPCWGQQAFAAGFLRKPLISLNGKNRTCFDLFPKRKDAEAKASVCFENTAKDTDKIMVEYKSHSEGWDIAVAHLWIGNNTAAIPVTEQDGSTPMYSLFPFRKERIASKSETFLVSMAKDLLGFRACPSTGQREADNMMALPHVVLQHTESSKSLHFDNNEGQVESLINQTIPLKISCSSEQDPSPSSSQEKKDVNSRSSSSLKNINLPTTSIRRRNQEDRQCPTYPDDIAFNISETFLSQILQGLELASVVQDCPIDIEEQRKKYERFDGWNDWNDQTLVAKTNDTGECYAAFRAVQDLNPTDQWQNINPFTIEVGEGSNCVVRRGYYYAYRSRGYYDVFRSSLESCLNSCGGENETCPLNLIGFSQGGAAAIAASVDLAEYNPMVITFGAPTTIVDPEECEIINKERYFRFVTTQNGGRFLAGDYDRVATRLGICNDKHVGWPIFLDNLQNWPLLTTGINDNRERRPLEQSLHNRGLYSERLSALKEQGCFPIPVSRWRAGHYCNYNDECLSLFCDDGECQPS